MTNIGVIGAGYIANYHLEVLSTMQYTANVIAICNRSEERRLTMQEKYNIPCAYKDYHEMLVRHKHKLDCIFVCVSIENMFNVIIDLLDYNIPLFVEKPIALSLEEARFVLNKAHIKNVPVMVGLNRRFMSSILEAKELIKTEIITSIIIEANECTHSLKYSEDVIKSWIFANGIHCIDLFRYFCGDVYRVESNVTMDKYTAVIDFYNGAKGFYVQNNVDTSWNIKIRGPYSRLDICPLEKLKYKIRYDKEETVFDLSELDKQFKPGLYKQDTYFIENIVINKEKITFPACDLADNYETMKLIDKIHKGNNNEYQ